MLGDEGTDRSSGVVDGEIESGLSNDGDALPRYREYVGIVLVVFDEGNTPGGYGCQVNDIDARAQIMEDGNVCSIIQTCPDSGSGAVDRGATDSSDDTSGLCWGGWGWGSMALIVDTLERGI